MTFKKLIFFYPLNQVPPLKLMVQHRDLRLINIKNMF